MALLEDLDLSSSLGFMNVAAILQLTEAALLKLETVSLAYNRLNAAAILQLSTSNWPKVQDLAYRSKDQCVGSITPCQGRWSKLKHIRGHKLHPLALMLGE